MRVHAAAITRDELDWPTDRLPAIPSYELSGVVDAVAPDVDGLAAGDEVYGMTPFDRDGVAAEFAVVPAERARAEAANARPRAERRHSAAGAERVAGPVRPRRARRPASAC